MTSRLAHALIGGFTGALALTVLHETARRLSPKAPRMDKLGRRAIARGLESIGVEPPSRDVLQAEAMIGDVLTNGLMYSLVGLGKPETALIRGAVIGGAAGLSTLFLPPLLGLGPGPDKTNPETRAMAVAWYFAGGIVAAVVYRRLASGRS